ncbi:hypothetical protein HO133_009023 [Letharia lupina]|uniref:Uncharacterized protein n=1 Tax=Letharia lupina TaxID=560253 RepID=A0A8H6CMC5_9LECA|nr:uncharacterized protein HO133_009023 [Letharia lupina]KAF6226157.1 hypothetical protein HO133_009023 [Letharia lupina]
MDVSMDRKDNCIDPAYLAHRSGANKSPEDRRVVYATYNCKAEGDLHEEYYRDRAKEWPATHMRKEGGELGATVALRYGFGSPMLSVASGKQLEV